MIVVYSHKNRKFVCSKDIKCYNRDMWKNIAWLGIGAVFIIFILRKAEDESGPSFEALNATIQDLNEESD